MVLKSRMTTDSVITAETCDRNHLPVKFCVNLYYYDKMVNSTTFNIFCRARRVRKRNWVAFMIIPYISREFEKGKAWETR